MKKSFKNQAKLIREQRKKIGKSQQDVAKNLRLVPMALCRMELGLSGIPYKHIHKLSKILAIPSHSIKLAILDDLTYHLMTS